MDKDPSEFRVTLRIPGNLASEMETVMRARGVTNSSDFVRQAIRRLVNEEMHALALEETRRAQQIREARATYGKTS